MGALRAAAVWIFGLLAGGIFGAIVGEHLTKTCIGLPLGFMGGVRVRMQPAVARSSPVTAA